MSNNNNDFYDYWNESDSAEEIREPDKVYFDRLIDNRDDEDIEMEKIIYESFTLAEKKGEEQMKEQIEELIGEMNIRKEKFSNILLKFQKVAYYDKDIKDIFVFIEFIIYNYIDMQLEYYTYDKETYNKIFNIKLLKEIRLTDSEIDLLKSIIIHTNHYK